MIGAGPAGLAAAWFLVGARPQVTVYDSEEKPGGSLRYLIPEFRLPAAVLDAELQPLWEAGVRFVGGSQMHYESDPQSAVRRRLRRRGREHRRAGQAAAEKAARRRTRLDASSSCASSAAGPRRLSGTGGRRRRRHHRRRCRPHRPALGRRGRDRRLPLRLRHHARRRPRDRGRPGGGRLVRVRRPPSQRRRGAGKATVILAAENSDGSRAPQGRRASTCSPTGSPAAPPTPACSWPATPSAAPARPSTRWPAASGRPWPSTPGCAAKTWPRSRRCWPTYATLPYLEQLEQGEALGATAQRLAERDPVWLKMGAGAEPAGSRRDAQDVQSQTAGRPRRRGGEGLLPGRRPGRGQALPAVRLPQPRRAATCSAWAWSTASPPTNWSRRAAASAWCEPQLEHPFIRRDMERCIACGRCVRVCRDVAGPACYDFTGRGFTINVDTPYGEALQLADCISCGRCVSTCPTGALTFNERAAQLVQGGREPLHHVPRVRQRLPGRRPGGDRHTSRTPARSG